MHYPDPLQLVRRTMLNPKGPGAIFRSNRLNLRPTWGKPVPSYRTPEGEVLLIFTNIVAPLSTYLPCLQETAHYSAEALALDITYYPHPTTANQVLYLQSLRGADHQTMLTNQRDRCIQVLMHRLLNNPTYPTVEAALKEAAIRLGIGPATVLKVMQEMEGFEYVPRPATGAARRRDPALPWFSRSDARFAVVQRALLSLRTRKLNQLPMVVDDLATEDPGGYPTRCPVTGMEFDWLDVSSYEAPKVGRLSREVPYGPGNVLLMSAFARRVLEATGRRETLGKFVANRPEVIQSVHRWLALYPTSDPDVHETLNYFAGATAHHTLTDDTTDTPNRTPAKDLSALINEWK